MSDAEEPRFDSMEAMLKARSLWESRGIPSRFKELKSATGKRYELEPVIERQLPDAIALLNNPDHRVAQTLSDDERKAVKLSIAKEQQGSVLKLAWQLSQITTIGLLLAIGLYWLLQALTT